MLVDRHFDIRITDNKDIDEVLKNDIKKMSSSGNIHLDIRNSKLNPDKFSELFGILSKGQPHQFKLDLTEVELNDDRVKDICKCLESYKDLSQFKLFMSNINLSDKQFESIFNSLGKLKNIQSLHLELENVDMNNQKRKIMESSLSNMKKLSDIYINVRRNNMKEEDIKVIDRLMNRINNRYFLI
jgi:hypothetical protein